MSDMKYTAGPWTICYDGQIDGADGHSVCHFQWDSFKEFNDSPNNKANAHLIAAAPELFVELRKTPCPRADFPGDTCEFWAEEYAQDRCTRCAAIVKAEGRSRG